jgi:hypothetical protein
MKPRQTALVIAVLLQAFAIPNAAQAAPDCFSGPTRHDNFYQNWEVNNRCGGTVKIPMSVEIDGKVS